MAKHLSLVVDNSDDGALVVKNGESVQEVFEYMREISESDLVLQWRKCLNLPVVDLKDQFNSFMQRNWRTFDQLLKVASNSKKPRNSFRQANHLIMLVYLRVMEIKMPSSPHFKQSKDIGQNEALGLWIEYFSQSILDFENSHFANNPAQDLTNSFHDQIDTTIETA